MKLNHEKKTDIKSISINETIYSLYLVDFFPTESCPLYRNVIMN